MFQNLINPTFVMHAIDNKSKSDADITDYLIQAIVAIIFILIIILFSMDYSKGRIGLACMLIFIVTSGLGFLIAIGHLVFKILWRQSKTDAAKEKTRSNLKLIFMIAKFSIIIIAMIMLLLIETKVIKVNNSALKANLK